MRYWGLRRDRLYRGGVNISSVTPQREKFTRWYVYYDSRDRPFGLLKFVGDEELPGGFSCEAIFDTYGVWRENLDLIGDWAKGECWPVSEEEAQAVEKKVIAQHKARLKAEKENYRGGVGQYWRD